VFEEHPGGMAPVDDSSTMTTSPLELGISRRIVPLLACHPASRGLDEVLSWSIELP
jgi:hypothetical protein